MAKDKTEYPLSCSSNNSSFFQIGNEFIDTDDATEEPVEQKNNFLDFEILARGPDTLDVGDIEKVCRETVDPSNLMKNQMMMLMFTIKIILKIMKSIENI